MLRCFLLVSVILILKSCHFLRDILLRTIVLDDSVVSRLRLLLLAQFFPAHFCRVTVKNISGLFIYKNCIHCVQIRGIEVSVFHGGTWEYHSSSTLRRVGLQWTDSKV